MKTDTVDTKTGELLERLTTYLRGRSDEELIQKKTDTEFAVNCLSAIDGRVDQELMRRAEERKATTIYGKGQNYVIETKKEVDRSKLLPLLEYLTPDEKKECYQSAGFQEIWVDEKHNMVKWNKAKRAHGGELATKMDEISFPGKASGKLVEVADSK